MAAGDGRRTRCLRCSGGLDETVGMTSYAGSWPGQELVSQVDGVGAGADAAVGGDEDWHWWPRAMTAS